MIRFRQSLYAPVLVALVSACTIPSANAGDWPHWMGPTRDNHWTSEKAPTEFPAAGLRSLWETKIGSGYSGPAVAGGKVYITDLITEANAKTDNFGRRELDGIERVLCLEDSTGVVLWKHEYPVRYTISYPAGPRCTPIIDGDNLYTLGAEGELICFAKDSGNVLWSKNLKTAYKTESALWGYAAHPRINGDYLYTLAGGEGSFAVCLNKRTGEEVWRYGTAKEIGYVPPSIVNAGGQPQLVLASGHALQAVSLDTGKPLWSVPYEASYGSIIMTPIYREPYLFIGGYSKKNLLVELDSRTPTASRVWQDVAKKAISPVNVQPMEVDGVVYGFDESGELIAFDLKTGTRYWETSKPVSDRPVSNGTAFISRSGKHFYLFNDSGELIVADLSKAGYQELARTKIIDPTNNANGRKVVWSAPAYANDSIYVRNDEKIIRVPFPGR